MNERDDHYSKWRQVSQRIAPAIRAGRLPSAWRSLEKVVVREPLASDELELGFLRRVLSFLANYDEIARARELLAAHERRRSSLGELSPAVATLYQVLQCLVACQARDYAEGLRIAAGISWEAVLSVPWAYTVRLLMVYKSGRHEELKELLRRSRDSKLQPPRLKDPYDRAVLFRLLGEAAYFQARQDKARAYTHLALRELEKAPEVDARLARMALGGTWGVHLMMEGRFEESEAYLQNAVDDAVRAGNVPLAAQFETDLAATHLEIGLPQRAESRLQVTIRSLRRLKPSPVVDYLLTYALLRSAMACSELGKRRKAERSLQEAETLLDRTDHWRLRATLSSVRGFCLGFCGDAALLPVALQELERAEAGFRSHGDLGWHNLGYVHMYRARILMRCGHNDLAAKQAECAMQLLEKCRRPFFAARVVHLQSQILASGGFPNADALYEDILRNLGTVTSPIRLFKILSNLYFYTWDRDEHLDLSVHHLRQVNRLAEVLDRETFQDLFERHVNRRVMRRMMARSLGVEPETVEEPA